MSGTSDPKMMELTTSLRGSDMEEADALTARGGIVSCPVALFVFTAALL